MRRFSEAFGSAFLRLGVCVSEPVCVHGPSKKTAKSLSLQDFPPSLGQADRTVLKDFCKPAWPRTPGMLKNIVPPSEAFCTGFRSLTRRVPQYL